MRGNAETMQRNGIVLSTAQELLDLGVIADIEGIACFSGYSEQEVKEAIASLRSQKAVSGDEHEVMATHSEQLVAAQEHNPWPDFKAMDDYADRLLREAGY